MCFNEFLWKSKSISNQMGRHNKRRKNRKGGPSPSFSTETSHRVVTMRDTKLLNGASAIPPPPREGTGPKRTYKKGPCLDVYLCTCGALKLIWELEKLDFAGD